jgi:hypothetical protein
MPIAGPSVSYSALLVPFMHAVANKISDVTNELPVVASGDQLSILLWNMFTFLFALQPMQKGSMTWFNCMQHSSLHKTQREHPFTPITAAATATLAKRCKSGSQTQTSNYRKKRTFRTQFFYVCGASPTPTNRLVQSLFCSHALVCLGFMLGRSCKRTDIAFPFVKTQSDLLNNM